jgi:hypothetical protein
MSIVLCEWNVLTLPILSLALGMEFALAHASARKKGRLETSPLFSCILLVPSNDVVTHFHPATNITSREWLKVLASYFYPSSYVRMRSLVGTSSEDVVAKTYARTATVTMAREEIKGCHQIRWADCLWNMHMIRVNHGWFCWIPCFFSPRYLPLVSREIVLTMCLLVRHYCISYK